MDFERIYAKHYRELFGFALLLRKNRTEAEDMVQEVFAKYYVELQKQTAFENPRAWLYKVLYNMSASQSKSKILHQKYIHHTEKNGNTTSQWEMDFFLSERQRIVFSILENMEERDRNLLTLYHNGLSYSEIAETLQMNPASVGTTLVRSIEKLKNLLKSNYHEMFE